MSYLAMKDEQLTLREKAKRVRRWLTSKGYTEHDRAIHQIVVEAHCRGAEIRAKQGAWEQKLNDIRL